MTQEIGDQAAIKYAVGFYDALGAERPYEDAHEFGRSAIDLKMIPEHLTPVLRKKRPKRTSRKKSKIQVDAESRENRSVRFYYYISKQKTEMLAAQLQTSPVVPNASLVSQVAALFEFMKENCYVKPFSAFNSDTSSFYIDKGEWRHGLFGFNATRKEIVSYFLWKVVDSTLILLVGSPNNILGESVVRSGIFVPGTSGALLSVLDFVRSELKTDEPTAVTLGPLPFYGSVGEGHRNTHSLAEGVVEPASTEIEIVPSLHVTSDRWHGLREDSGASSSRQHGNLHRGLGRFCLDNLGELTTANIEVVFKIYSTHNEVESSEDSPFGTILLASPLFVAID